MPVHAAGTASGMSYGRAHLVSKRGVGSDGRTRAASPAAVLGMAGPPGSVPRSFAGGSDGAGLFGQTRPQLSTKAVATNTRGLGNTPPPLKWSPLQEKIFLFITTLT